MRGKQSCPRTCLQKRGQAGHTFCLLCAVGVTDFAHRASPCFSLILVHDGAEDGAQTCVTGPPRHKMTKTPAVPSDGRPEDLIPGLPLQPHSACMDPPRRINNTTSLDIWKNSHLLTSCPVAMLTGSKCPSPSANLCLRSLLRPNIWMDYSAK